MIEYNGSLDPWPDPYKGMTEKERTWNGCMQGFIFFLFILLVFLACALMGGCRSPQVVTVPEVHEHWHHQKDTIHKTDSVIDRQTTIIREVDSATMAAYGIRLQGMQRAWLVDNQRWQRELSELRQTHADTIHERDSIPYPVEVVREVPRKRSTMEWGLLTIGAIALIGGIVWISVRIKR
jgi:hypothetical protein